MQCFQAVSGIKIGDNRKKGCCSRTPVSFGELENRSLEILEIEEVARNIFRIPVRLPENPLRALNSYLIRDTERSLLVDAGFRHEKCREDIMAGFASLGLDISEIDIYLTHMHADHSGLASSIAGRGRRIYISAADLSWLKDVISVDDNWERFNSRYVGASMPESIIKNMAEINPAIKMSAAPGSHEYTKLYEGDTLSAGGYAFRCVATPGHTPGHMCLWSEETGVMFTGDHVLFDITPNITSWPSVEDSLGEYLESLKAVREYPVKTALPGHRNTGDFHARIDELIEHHRRRLAEIVDIVSGNPGISTYEIAGKMKWRIRAVNWDEFPGAQKIFAVGECMSHLDYLCLRGKISRKREAGVDRYSSV